VIDVLRFPIRRLTVIDKVQANSTTNTLFNVVRCRELKSTAKVDEAYAVTERMPYAR